MSLALHYWMGGAHHCSGPPISEMTYTVSSGTLKPSIPYRIPLWRGRGWPLETRCSPSVFIPHFLGVSQTAWASVRGPKILGTLELRFWDVDMADSQKYASSPPVLPCQIRSLKIKPYERNYGDLPEKFDPSRPPSRSFKVNSTDTDRSHTCDCLLVFHSNYSLVSYRFQDKWRYYQNKL